MAALLHAHSGVRYPVLLAAAAALVVLAYALATGRAVGAAHRVAMTFTGLLDLQVLLGIALVLGGRFSDAVAGHLALMVVALVVAHGASMISNRAREERRALGIRLVGVVVTVAVVAGGILAIRTE